MGAGVGGGEGKLKSPGKWLQDLKIEMSKLIQGCTEKKENCFSQVPNASEAVNCTDPSLPHSLFSNRL